MKKNTKILTLLLSGAFAISSLTGCFGGNNNSSSSSSSPSASGGGNGDTYTIETLYAKAQDLGFEGTLEEFKEYVKGDRGEDGVGIEDIYVSGGDLYIVLSNGDEYNCGSILGEKGNPGESGATWFSGNGAPGTISGVKVGDFYFDNASGNVYEYKSSGWVFSTCLKPAQTYVGYDGYIWEGATRTEQKVELARNKYEIEDTLPLKDNEYFEEKEVATSSKIVMMSGYQSYSGNTIYSNKILKELVIYAKTAGKLEIGKINLSSKSATSAGAFTLVAGKNVVSLHLELGAGETLTLGGGQSTATLLASAKVAGAADTCGEYSTNTSTFAMSQTSGINNKLLIFSMRAERIGVVTREVHAGARQFLEGATLSPVSQEYAPYIHYDLNAYSNGRLNKIGLYVQSINNLDAWQSFTIFRVKKNDIHEGVAVNPVKEYTFRPSLECWSANGVTSTTVNKWIEFDVSYLGIEVAEDETLAFGKSTDSITISFRQSKDYRYAYYSNCFANLPSNVQSPCAFNSDFSLPIYAEMEQTITDDEYTEKFAKEEVFAKHLKGKKISIMGDSISTFDGWNNNTSYNSTLGNNAVYYKTTNDYWAWLENVDQTWWKRTINNTGMQLCVNNAWSGSYVWNTDGGDSLGSSNARAYNLHNNAGIQPDVIAVYLGTNDYLNGKSRNIAVGGTLTSDKMSSLVSGSAGNYTYATPTTFLEGYAIMMHKIVNKYQSADVFCFTILPNMSAIYSNISGTKVQEYNDAIRSVANYFNLPIVDLYYDSGITYETGLQYSADWSLVHPNAAGMEKISNCFINKLYDFYKNN